MGNLQLVPKLDKKVYLCRGCRWHGEKPKYHTFGGGGIIVTHILCPECKRMFRQIDNVREFLGRG